MKRTLSLLLGLALVAPLFLSLKVYGQAKDETIISRTAEIDGVKLHYITAGHGTPLIGADHRRGQVVGRNARATSQAGGNRRDRRRAEGDRTLGA